MMWNKKRNFATTITYTKDSMLITKNVILSLTLLLLAVPAHAQPKADAEVRPWQQYLDDLSATEDFESQSWADYEDVLDEYAEHPMNINTATTEDLQRLPFLSARQIEDIEAYVYQYGEMKSLGELAMIPSISWYQRQLLGYFVYAGKVEKRQFPTLGQIAKYGKHEAVGMVKVPFYERKGDADGSYLGGRYKHWLRYQFRYGDYVKLGVLGSQDAGEPFFAKGNGAGYDYYSFYLQIRKWGRLKNLTLGRYRLHEGMGLILNNDFSMGKVSMLSSLCRNSQVIRVHSSRYAANYLQGAAATIALSHHFDLTAFVSYRTIDATIKDGGIRTLLTSGLHRTALEMEKKDVASTFLVGGNVSYRLGAFHVGTTAFYHSFSKPLVPNRQLLYKRYAPVGANFWNASIDYGYVSHRLSVQGETATGSCGAVATVNAMSYALTERLSLIALQRFYPYRYYALYANAFSEGTDVQDESGVYVGANWSPTDKWNLTAYTDVAYFAWPKFGTTGSTHSWDNLLSVVFRPSAILTLGGRYRYKDKQGTSTQRARLYAVYATTAWNGKTQVDASYVSDKTTSLGWMASQQAGYVHRWLRLNAIVGYFHTADYASRVYVYEPTVLYGSSWCSCSGQGMRYVLMARADVGKHLVGIAKLGGTSYFDRDHISSGLQQIDGSSQVDLEIQVKWKW